jgi:hypothetical protein
MRVTHGRLSPFRPKGRLTPSTSYRNHTWTSFRVVLVHRAPSVWLLLWSLFRLGWVLLSCSWVKHTSSWLDMSRFILNYFSSSPEVGPIRESWTDMIATWFLRLQCQYALIQVTLAEYRVIRDRFQVHTMICEGRARLNGERPGTSHEVLDEKWSGCCLVSWTPDFPANGFVFALAEPSARSKH